MEINSELFLFDRIWFSKVFKIARESGLDWLRMCAAAEVLSSGDTRARNIDWLFIRNNLGLDSPIFATFYDVMENPTAEIIDRGTRWGLFQIYGEQAIQYGHTGKLVNLIDITKNVQVACRLLTQQIQASEMLAKIWGDQGEKERAENLIKSLPQAAEEALGWPTKQIDEKVDELKKQMESLLTFGDLT